MEILISPQVPNTDKVKYLHQAATRCLRMNSGWLAIQDIPWELIGVIVIGENEEDIRITFAMRSTEDGRIRVTVEATDDEESIPVEAILESKDGYMDPTLFLKLITRAVEKAAEFTEEKSANKLQ